MKVIIAATPAPGHLNPLLSITRMLVSHGHEVVGLTASAYGPRFIRAGARFEAFPGNLDRDLHDIDAVFPQRKALVPGPEMLRFDLDHVFIEPMAGQHQALRGILRDFPADLILCDNLFLGTLPMLSQPRAARPAIVHCGITFLCTGRDDGAPLGLGLPPLTGDAASGAYRDIHALVSEQFLDPVQHSLDHALGMLGCGPLALPMFDAVTVLPDLYLQPTVPGFEYPRRQAVASLRFIGALPLPPLDATPPEWADELDGSRRVVLVTQGTLANHDLGQLIGPTLEALADRPDLLVLVTTGGRPLDAIPTRLPDNARVAAFLPYDWLMPKLDVVVTNGGYGTVNHALSLGLPLVVAGVTEDKAEVAARVAWSGSGINLATNNPTAAALRQAIDAVLDEERYRLGARSLSREFAGYDAETEVLRLLEAAARPAAAASLAA